MFDFQTHRLLIVRFIDIELHVKESANHETQTPCRVFVHTGTTKDLVENPQKAGIKQIYDLESLAEAEVCLSFLSRQPINQ